MIYYLLQSYSADPDLARGTLPAGLLTDAEAARWAGFRVEKRRREWLLGRWTAKRLLRLVLKQESGESIDPGALTIANDASGAPFATTQDLTCLYGLSGLALSISHSGEYAFCAVVRKSEGIEGLGADIERVEPRSPEFVADYFTAEEIRNLASSAEPQRDRLITATWSGKESALKALRLGLRADTRSVSCLIEPFVEPPRNWERFKVCCNMRPLQASPELGGWWRIFGEYVLTLVTTAGTGEEIEQVLPEREWDDGGSRERGESTT